MIKVQSCTFFNRLYKTTSIFPVSKDIKIIFHEKKYISVPSLIFAMFVPGGGAFDRLI